MTEPSLDELSLFCHSMDNMEAQVRASLPRPGEGDWQLAGRIVGPRCDFTSTLKATVPLQFVPRTADIQAAGTVPDPCFWTPELPMLYDASVELRRGGELVDRAERTLALRALAPTRQNLVLSGRRWVLRGAQRATVPDSPLSTWRTASAAMLVEGLDIELADEAARLGVPLMVRLHETDPDAIAAQIRRLGRMAAVTVVAIDAAADLLDGMVRPPMGLLLAAYCRAESAPPALPRWSQLMLCESADGEAIARAAARCQHPVIALRPLGQAADIVTARAACDKLQRDLAPQADLAGYIV